MMTRRNLLRSAAIATSAATSIAAADPTPPVRVLLVTGGHDHPVSFYSVFEGEGATGFRVNVNPHPLAFTSDMRKRYDVIVLYDLIKDGLETKKRDNLKAFAESGKGIVVVHHALVSHVDWPWWYEEVTGARWIDAGAAGMPSSSTFKEGLELEISPVAPSHPVLRGISGPFHIVDETYGKLWFSPKIEVLMKTNHPSSDGPVVWVGPWKQSRVITVQLGHGSEAHRNENYRKLLHNAVRWAAAGGGSGAQTAVR